MPAIPFPSPPRSPLDAIPGRWRFRHALGLSLLVHGALLAGGFAALAPSIANRPFPLVVSLPAPPTIEPNARPAATAPAQPARKSPSLPGKIAVDTGLRTAPPAPPPPPVAVTDNTDPSGPGLDLATAARRQARDLGRQPTSSPRLAGPGQTPGDTPLARSIAQAARPDCRTAHSDAGLLALPLLFIDAAAGRDCAW